METIKECRESGDTVSNWCKEHSISEASYYYYLKKIRKKACEMLPTETPSQFVPISVASETTSTANIVFHKGDITIEVSNALTEDLIRLIIGGLSC